MKPSESRLKNNAQKIRFNSVKQFLLESSVDEKERFIEESARLLAQDFNNQTNVFLSMLIDPYEIDDADPQFCAGYNACVEAWKTQLLIIRTELQRTDSTPPVTEEKRKQ